MLKPLITALALAAMTMTGITAQAEAKAGTHTMWITPFKAAPYAVLHDNATCPNRPSNSGK